MIKNQRVCYGGEAYVWQHWPEGEPWNCWTWLTGDEKRVPEKTVCQALNKLFLQKVAPEIARDMGESDVNRFLSIIQSLGVPPREARARFLGSSGVANLSEFVERNGRCCIECKQKAADYYPNGRCKACHEQEVRTARKRAIYNAEYWNGRRGS